MLLLSLLLGPILYFKSGSTYLWNIKTIKKAEIEFYNETNPFYPLSDINISSLKLKDKDIWSYHNSLTLEESAISSKDFNSLKFFKFILHQINYQMDLNK